MVDKLDVEEAVLQVRKKVKILTIKSGEAGGKVFVKEQHFHCPAIGAQVADTIGAGDHFDAGFVDGYLQGWALEECLKLGCFAGGKSNQAPGGIAGQPVGITGFLQ